MRITLFATALVLNTFVFSIDVSHAALPQDARRAGGIAIIEVKPETTGANLDGQAVALVVEKNKSYAVAGIPVNASVGIHTLKTDQGNYDFTIADYAYPEQHLTLADTSKVNLNSEQSNRYQQDLIDQSKVYQSFSPSQNKDFPSFIWPLVGRITSPFGFKRFINGEPREPNNGLSIAAPYGTVVHSPAAGVVIKIGDYFFNGRTVMIDHGQGIISMLCHLSRIDATVGQVVSQGDPIGLLGMTGRVTGPVLFLRVNLNNTQVDPLLVLPQKEDH